MINYIVIIFLDQGYMVMYQEFNVVVAIYIGHIELSTRNFMSSSLKTSVRGRAVKIAYKCKSDAGRTCIRVDIYLSTHTSV